MRGYLEDLKAGGRPMTDKELADHYKHLYSVVKKQKDDVVDWLKNNYCYIGEKMSLKPYSDLNDLLRMLGEIE